MFRSILVPLDGSSFAEQALPWAELIAQGCDSTLNLVTGHRLYAFEDYSCAWAPYDAAQDAQFRQKEQQYLAAVATQKMTLERDRVLTRVTDGLAADAILAGVRGTQADLIVMTTHGQGPLSRAFLGSVADEVIRRAPVPVLLIRPDSTTLPSKPCVSSIMVPLDGSSFAEQIIPTVIGLAGKLNASCHLCSVVQPDTSVVTRREAGLEEGLNRTVPECGVDQAQAYLTGVAERFGQHSVQATSRVVEGHYVANAIVAEAQNAKCELIALATHGRSGVKRLVLGSVADKVIRTANTPVLVLPAGAEVVLLG